MSLPDVTTRPVVSVRWHDDVAVVQIDNPPVNGLGAEVRGGLAQALDDAAAEDRLAAIVLTGNGAGFSAGADVTQFNTPAATEEPMLRQLVERLQASRVPVVAAIHGYAFGGALELALGCQHRVASPGARLGLTETSLGIVPGAGGTQFLPRLIGVPAALDMIQHARRISADNAHELGLVDDVLIGEIIAGAVAFARQAAGQPSGGFVADASPVESDFDFDARRAGVRRRDQTATAQLAAIECIELATKTVLTAGCDAERVVFDRLVTSPESRAIQHLAFAERAAASVRALTRERRPVRRVGVVGAGTMGGGIAMAFADHGFDVLLNDASVEGLQAGMARVRSNYELSVARGTLGQHNMEERLARIRPAESLEGFADVDLVIEAVFEDMTVKQDVFARLDAVCRPDAILASNTSRLDVTALARTTVRPSRVVGLHFFSPANVMPLLEIVRAADTADDVLATCLTMASSIQKKPVTVGVCEGFVGNRMLTPYWTESWFLVEEGATPQQVDWAMEAFGMAMGPFRVADLAGLDINWAARKRLASMRDPNLRYSRVADLVCEAGRFGQKSGAGWYRYEDGARIGTPDSAVDEIIEQSAREAGIVRRAVSDEEIVSRCVLALVNEGAKILDDGIVARSGDIDVVYVNGYGFPAACGGPMFWGEQESLHVVLERIEGLRAEHGERWRPARRLVDQVAAGKTTFDLKGQG
jgi:3-hydroxyacyl-CoA dehydrogenase